MKPKFEFDKIYIGVIEDLYSVDFEYIKLASINKNYLTASSYRYEFFVKGVKNPMEFTVDNIFDNIQDAEKAVINRYSNRTVNALERFKRKNDNNEDMEGSAPFWEI